VNNTYNIKCFPAREDHERPPCRKQWRLLLALLAGLLPAVVQAQLIADTLAIRFQLDSTCVNMNFDNNGRRWAAFESTFMQNFSHLPANNLRLDIYAGASPEGTASHNRWLGENRGQAIRRLIHQRLGQHVGQIVVHNEAARWNSFYDMVAESNEPWRDEVLAIIDQPASSDETQLDHRELKLRRLRGGKIWPVLLERYLAPLRSGASAILSWQSSGRDTIVVRDTVFVVRDTVFIASPLPAVAPIVYTGFPGYYGKPGLTKAQRDSLRYERLQYPAWAVKTNLLLWSVVAPNIEVEIPLGRYNRWSLEAEYFVPWFTWNDNARASQFHNFGLELRYWLGHRQLHRWLQGMHIGLAVAAGYYDWEWKKHEGYQGEYVNAYFNLGFQHRWGTHWALDMGLGLGLMATKYRHYYGGSVYPQNHLEPRDEHLIWHDTGHYLWPGPCHASLALVYMFNAWPFHTKDRKLDAYR